MRQPAPLTRYVGNASPESHEHPRNRAIRLEVLAALDALMSPGSYGEICLTLKVEDGIFARDILVTRTERRRVH